MRYESAPESLYAEGWTRLTCAACHAQFDINFRHRCEAEGYDREADRDVATDDIIDAELAFHRVRACPECGALPAPALASKRMLGDAFFALIGTVIAASILGATWFHPPGGADAANSLMGIAAAAFGQTIVHALFARMYGFRAPDHERGATERLQRRGRVEVREPHAERDNPKFRWPSRRPGMLLLAVAVAAPAAPLAMLATGPDAVNEHTAPAIVGPGDRATVGLDGTLRSMRRAWHGRVNATVTNADELGLPSPGVLAAKSHEGNAEHHKFQSNEYEQSFRPTVDIGIPDESNFAGKVIELDIVVEPSVAERVGMQYEWREVPHLREHHTIRVSSREDARLYEILLHGGMAATVLGACAAGAWFWRCNRRLRECPPPDVYVGRFRKDGGRQKPRFSWTEYRAGEGIQYES